MNYTLKILLLFLILVTISCTKEPEYSSNHLLYSDGNKLYYIARGKTLGAKLIKDIRGDGKEILKSIYFDVKSTRVFFSSNGKNWTEISTTLLETLFEPYSNLTIERSKKDISRYYSLSKEEIDFLMSIIEILNNKYIDPKIITIHDPKNNYDNFNKYRLIVGRKLQRTISETDSNSFLDKMNNFLLHGDFNREWITLWNFPNRRTTFLKLFYFYDYYPQDLIFTPDGKRLIVPICHSTNYHPYYRFLVFERDGSFKKMGLYQVEDAQDLEQYSLKPIQKSKLLPDHTDKINIIYQVFNDSQIESILPIAFLILILAFCFKIVFFIYRYIKNKSSITKDLIILTIGNILIGLLFLILYDLSSIISYKRSIIEIIGYGYFGSIVKNIPLIILWVAIIYFTYRFKGTFFTGLIFILGLILFPYLGFMFWAMGIIPWYETYLIFGYILVAITGYLWFRSYRQLFITKSNP